MASRRPDTQEEFGWWLEELEQHDALSDQDVADRYAALKAGTNNPRGLARRLMKLEALEHTMALRFLWNTTKKEAAPGEGPPKSSKVLR
jgi:SOS response regulatory protein OraA/RecX